ncbi:MAG TPA: CDP-alcohol phosphatidyltransferase family protein [Ktedonobacteraceae bacterium]|nr:CDP-alcohol phosphatidyltransferase family protein [Ktedonobacteraceae bacterium]
MFSRRIQQRARELVALIMRPLARTGVTPNTLTLLGLLLSILTAVVIAQGWLLAGGLLMLFAGIFDMFDGAIARIRNAATTFGAFLDSTLDRYSESIILFGLLYYTLQRPALQDPLWPFHSEQPWMITLIYIAVVGSLLVSYTKARAEGLGLECKTGLLARPERVVILALGLLTGTTIWALILLAVFSNVTAIERIAHVWGITLRKPVATSEPVQISGSTGGDGQVSHFHLDTMQTGASDGLEPAPIPLANTWNPGSHSNVDGGPHRVNAEE